MNAVAGGGSFIALPALLYAGVAPVVANATNTFALWPASLSSAWAYRREIVATRSRLVTLGAVSIAGGLAGGLLMVRTSDARFMRLLPWLMLVAAATFTFVGEPPADAARGFGRRSSRADVPWVMLLQLAIAVYGGYFGGGMGIMTLAALSIAGMTDIHEMNGVKSALAVAINGVSLAEFILHGAIAWTPGVIMVAGAIVGGYAGASIARRVSQQVVRTFIIVIAWALTVFFFVR